MCQQVQEAILFETMSYMGVATRRMNYRGETRLLASVNTYERDQSVNV